MGEPRTVRMIYFLPNDRPYRAEVVDSMKVRIRRIQTFYAEQMQAYGYGDKTFHVETDAQGDRLVHRVDGQHPDSHYLTRRIWVLCLTRLKRCLISKRTFTSSSLTIVQGNTLGGVALPAGRKVAGLR